MKLSDIYRKPSGVKASLGSQGASFSANVSTADIIRDVKTVLAKNPGVEKATGKIDIKVKGQPKKTLTFNYK